VADSSTNVAVPTDFRRFHIYINAKIKRLVFFPTAYAVRVHTITSLCPNVIIDWRVRGWGERDTIKSISRRRTKNVRIVRVGRANRNE